MPKRIKWESFTTETMHNTWRWEELPVVSLCLNFKKSALYDDLITVETRLKKIPLVKIEFDYIISNEENEILAEANTVLAFMDKDKNRPMKCPEYILEKIKA